MTAFIRQSFRVQLVQGSQSTTTLKGTGLALVVKDREAEMGGVYAAFMTVKLATKQSKPVPLAGRT